VDFHGPVELNVVEGGESKRIAYDQAQFDYGALKITEKLPDMGFSGFRVLRAQTAARGDDRAVSGRELFPRPRPPGSAARRDRARAVPAHGRFARRGIPGLSRLLDRKAGAWRQHLGYPCLARFVERHGRLSLHASPGEATIIDTEMTLFPRVDLDHVASPDSPAPHCSRRSIAAAPTTSAPRGGNERLQILTGKNEWVWRPLSNRNNLQLSSFVDANPKGFGFLTRDRDISAYQDDVAHWSNVLAVGRTAREWGEGAVQLVEIPSESDFNQNIIAYWRPKQLLANGAEANFAYRQFWCWEPPARPPCLCRGRARRSRGSPKLAVFSSFSPAIFLATPPGSRR